MAGHESIIKNEKGLLRNGNMMVLKVLNQFKGIGTAGSSDVDGG